MTKSICIFPRILREDYAAFLVALKDDPEFPATYDEWHTKSTQAIAKRVAQGHTVNEIVLSPNDLIIYCNGCGQSASVALLNAYAVAQSAKRP